jgi:anti-anti-sigma factor
VRIDEQQHGAVTVLSPHGPLVEGEVEAFCGAVRAGRDGSRGRLVLDLTDMHFVDSAGLEALLDLAEEFEAAALSLKLAAANETVREVLDLTGLTGDFEFFSDAHDASRSFM